MTPPARRRAVFLDRDGVLNRVTVRQGRPHPPQDLAELEILPGVGEALDRLRQAGFVLIVVTNQPDVARGAQRREVVEALNGALKAQLGLDDVRVCYHDDSDDCACRKPRPGLLLEAARDWDVDLRSSYMVGDRWKDVEAGRRAGCKTVFIEPGSRGRGQSTANRCGRSTADAEPAPQAPDHVAASLSEAAEWMLCARARPPNAP